MPFVKNQFTVNFHKATSLLVFLKVCDRSTSPEWSEAFYFLVHDPTDEILIIKVKYSRWSSDI